MNENSSRSSPNSVIRRTPSSSTDDRGRAAGCSAGAGPPDAGLSSAGPSGVDGAAADSAAADSLTGRSILRPRPDGAGVRRCHPDIGTAINDRLANGLANGLADGLGARRRRAGLTVHHRGVDGGRTSAGRSLVGAADQPEAHQYHQNQPGRDGPELHEARPRRRLGRRHLLHRLRVGCGSRIAGDDLLGRQLQEAGIGAEIAAGEHGGGQPFEIVVLEGFAHVNRKIQRIRHLAGGDLQRLTRRAQARSRARLLHIASGFGLRRVARSHQHLPPATWALRTAAPLWNPDRGCSTPGRSSPWHPCCRSPERSSCRGTGNAASAGSGS